MKKKMNLLALAAIMLLIPTLSEARITQFEILSVQSPTFEGLSFGDVGMYEKIIARAYAEVDPSDPRNALITDIDLAPRNDNGMVEYSTEVYIIKPVDMSKGNGRIYYNVVNRGNKGHGDFNGVGGNDPTTAADAGSGLLMRLGYTLVFSGWEDERMVSPANNRTVARLPMAKNPDGSSIINQIITEVIFDHPTNNRLTLLYTAADLDKAQARMLVHNHTRFVGGPLVDRVEVPTEAWAYVNEKTVQIDRDHPFLAPYDQGAAYEFIYPAKDSHVLGLGLAATRDVISFLRHNPLAENPLSGAIQYAIAHGSSQSGRYLKGFTYWGFNEDEDGHMVFDGIMPKISGAHAIEINDRFGDTGATGRSYQRELNSKMEFPFTYEVRTDPVSGLTDGIFIRCQDTNTCPKVMHVDGGNEAWLKANSLVTTDGLGADIDLPDNVRVFYVASTQHGASATPQVTATCQQLTNPNPMNPTVRALFIALDDWATKGVPPPANRHPKVGDGTLAPSLPQSSLGFPEIPGVNYTGWYIPVAVKDKTSLPNMWIPGKEYVVLEPKTDADGNDIAGIRTPYIQAPLGTYTGWALRRAPFAENEDCALTGQYIPFPATKAERLFSGDPRLSVEERYPNHGSYVSKVVRAVNELVKDRFLLTEDGEIMKEEAALSNIGKPRK